MGSVVCDIVFYEGELSKVHLGKEGKAVGGGYDRRSASFYDCLAKRGYDKEILNKYHNTNWTDFLKEFGYIVTDIL